MSAALTLPNDEAAILERAIHPTRWTLTPDAARAIVKLALSPDDAARMDELSAKANAGTLSPEEEVEIEEYRQVGCLIELMKSTARRFLKSAGQQP